MHECDNRKEMDWRIEQRGAVNEGLKNEVRNGEECKDEGETTQIREGERGAGEERGRKICGKEGMKGVSGKEEGKMRWRRGR